MFVFIPSYVSSAQHKGALSLLAHSADGDMMARRHSRVNIIRESLFSKLHQPEIKKKKAERTRKHKEEYGTFWADETFGVFLGCSKAKIPDLNCKQG